MATANDDILGMDAMGATDSPEAATKIENGPSDMKSENSKSHKPLNRVPRACNACRKQKMRCEIGPDTSVPCKRCKNAGIECQFEKPQREANLSAEQTERLRQMEEGIRSMRKELEMSRRETHQALNTIIELLRKDPYERPPSVSHDGRGYDERGLVTMRTPGTASHISSYDTGMRPPSSKGISYDHPSPHGQSPSSQPPYLTGKPVFPPPISPVPTTSSSTIRSTPNLPPIRTASTEYPPQPPSRGGGGYHAGFFSRAPAPIPALLPAGQQQAATSRRGRPDNEQSHSDEELPATGLMAPLETIRQLGSNEIDYSQHLHGPVRSPTPPFHHHENPNADLNTRPTKRRKISHLPKHDFPDVVTKELLTASEAKELFNIFYTGCSTFLSVFDKDVDTFEVLHAQSPFAVNAICMVASQVRDSGGPVSRTTQICIDEVRNICAQTLFHSVASVDAVRAVLIVAGWSSNGWLTCGHAVRMAMELELNKAWPTLMDLMEKGKAAPNDKQRNLVVSARIWFCLFLMDHQMSFGSGRAAILREDESIQYPIKLLQHPLSVDDDARLASTVELMVLRERAHNSLPPPEYVFTDIQYEELRKVIDGYRTWHGMWDNLFSRRFGEQAFYRKSLQIQKLFAEMFYFAIPLQNIHGPSEVANMTPAQRAVAADAIRCVSSGLDICLHSSTYREGLRYAVSYTHLTVTFAASFLMRLARLFPEYTQEIGGIDKVLSDAEKLADILSSIPATRYAKTLRLMINSRRKRTLGGKGIETTRPPTSATRTGVSSIQAQPVQAQHPQAHLMPTIHFDDTAINLMKDYFGSKSTSGPAATMVQSIIAPPIVPSHGGAPMAYNSGMGTSGGSGGGNPNVPNHNSSNNNSSGARIPSRMGSIMNPSPSPSGSTPSVNGGAVVGYGLDYSPPPDVMVGVEVQPGQPVPTWAHESNLGGRFGIESFIIPQQYEEGARQIW